MTLTMRLDENGNPYLVIEHDNTEKQNPSVQEDAERLFFKRLTEKSGSFSIFRKDDRITKLIMTTSHNKREISSSELDALGLDESGAYKVKQK